MNRRVVVSLFAVCGSTVPALAQCVPQSWPMGSGCGFSTPWGVPIAQCTGQPTIGNAAFGFTSSTQCVGAPVTAILLVGTCLTPPVLFTNPSSGLCLSEAVCALHVNPIAVVPGVLQGGSFAYATPIPNVPQFVGLQVCVQSAHWCTGLPCIMASNAVRVTLL
jgi:hypothetical protein